MKSFLEEYGSIVVACIIIFIMLGIAKPLGFDLNNGMGNVSNQKVDIPESSNGTYTITYEPNGGKMPEKYPKTYNEYDGLFKLPAPTKQGYEFGGWYEEATPEKTLPAPPSSDFEPPTDNGDGTWQYSKELSGFQGKKDLVIDFELKNEGYVDFDVTAGGIPQYGYATIEGVSLDDKKLFEGRDQKAGTYKNQKLQAGKHKITINADVYDFGHVWVNQFKIVEKSMPIKNIEPGTKGNKTLYAGWEQSKKTMYNLTFDPVGGTLPSGYPTEIAKEDGLASLPTPTKPGHIFKGWLKLPGRKYIRGWSGVPLPFNKINGDFTTPIGWEQERIYNNFKYVLNNETGYYNSYRKITANVYFDLDCEPTLVKPNIRGLGNDISIQNILIDGQSANDYINLQYGLHELSFEVKFNNEALTTDTIFMDFVTSQDSIIYFVPETAPVFSIAPNDTLFFKNKDIALKALWVPEFTIDYEPNGGTMPSSYPTKYTTEDTITLPTPTKAGYIFKGWSTLDGVNRKPFTIPASAGWNNGYNQSEYMLNILNDISNGYYVTPNDVRFEFDLAQKSDVIVNCSTLVAGPEVKLHGITVDNVPRTEGERITLPAGHHVLRIKVQASQGSGRYANIVLNLTSEETEDVYHIIPSTIKYNSGSVKLYAVWQKEKSVLVDGMSFNSKINSLNARHVIFKNQTKPTPPAGSQIIDLSQERDKSIVGYMDGDSLYVCSESQIIANQDCSYMFYFINSVESIDFGYCDFTQTQNMEVMLSGMTNLKSVTSIDSRANNMHRMFAGASNLQKASIRIMNPSADVTEMFDNVASSSGQYGNLEIYVYDNYSPGTIAKADEAANTNYEGYVQRR